MYPYPYHFNKKYTRSLVVDIRRKYHSIWKQKMKIVIHILFIVMPEIRENIGMKNHHPFHKTNGSISNEGNDLQGEDFIFYSASIVFYSFEFNDYWLRYFDSYVTMLLLYI